MGVKTLIYYLNVKAQPKILDIGTAQLRLFRSTFLSSSSTCKSSQWDAVDAGVKAPQTPQCPIILATTLWK